jgi:hypothetical protein
LPVVSTGKNQWVGSLLKILIVIVQIVVSAGFGHGRRGCARTGEAASRHSARKVARAKKRVQPDVAVSLCLLDFGILCSSALTVKRSFSRRR